MPTGTAQSALEPIAAAIYTALNGSVTFTALSPILNEVPQGQLRPYTILENFTEVPWNTMGEFGKTVTFQLHIISDATGDREGIRILNAAIGALDYQKFAVTNHKMVQCKYEHLQHWTEEAIGGVKVRHFVPIFRVDVTQS